MSLRADSNSHARIAHSLVLFVKWARNGKKCTANWQNICAYHFLSLLPANICTAASAQTRCCYQKIDLKKKKNYTPPKFPQNKKSFVIYFRTSCLENKCIFGVWIVGIYRWGEQHDHSSCNALSAFIVFFCCKSRLDCIVVIIVDVLHGSKSSGKNYEITNFFDKNQFYSLT